MPSVGLITYPYNTTINIQSILDRAVDGSVRVGFVPNSEPTCRNRVEKKGTRCRPVGVIGSGSSEHQRVAGESVGFGMARKRRNRFQVMKTRRSSRVGRFRVGSGRFFGWVEYSDESG